MDPQNGDADAAAAKKKLRKNPNVDTSFLPDREREEAERREREELRKEWLRKQEELKEEEMEVTYSFWDGSGHRKSVVVSCAFASTLLSVSDLLVDYMNNVLEYV